MCASTWYINLVMAFMISNNEPNPFAHTLCNGGAIMGLQWRWVSLDWRASLMPHIRYVRQLCTLNFIMAFMIHFEQWFDPHLLQWPIEIVWWYGGGIYGLGSDAIITCRSACWNRLLLFFLSTCKAEYWFTCVSLPSIGHEPPLTISGSSKVCVVNKYLTCF